MQKRVITIWLAAAILLAGCGLDSELETDKLQNQKSGEEILQTTDASTVNIFTVPYDSADTLSPFGTSCKLNSRILPLIYDGLFATDENYRAVNKICESYTCDGLKYTLKLRKGLFFADGTELTAEDVKYSLEEYKTAKNPVYKSHVKNISRIEITDDRTITITLNEYNGSLPSLLTMPIVRKGTADDDIPQGVGRYLISWDGDSYKLTPNPNCCDGENIFGDINLFPILKTDELIYAMTAKNISVVEAEKLNSEGALIFHGNIPTQSFDTMNMQYLCFNTKNEYLSDSTMRQALSKIVNRKGLCENIFSGFAQPVVLPVNQDAYFSPEQNVMRNTQEAMSLLKEIGFRDDDDDGIIDISEDYKIPELTLLVNEDNDYKVNAANFIAQEFLSVGLKVTVERVEFSEFKNRLNTGNFDIALCETALSPDFNISEFLKGTLNFGKWKQSEANSDGIEKLSLLECWNDVASAQEIEKKAAYEKFAAAFSEEMPFAPLCFEKGALLFNILPKNAKITSEDIFANVQDWYY